MDEATIHCAVMWAQGARSVHLNIKFAARLDAPVTVLNVDNEKAKNNQNNKSLTLLPCLTYTTRACATLHLLV